VDRGDRAMTHVVVKPLISEVLLVCVTISSHVLSNNHLSKHGPNTGKQLQSWAKWVQVPFCIENRSFERHAEVLLSHIRFDYLHTLRSDTLSCNATMLSNS
jgi:hypothetical protein